MNASLHHAVSGVALTVALVSVAVFGSIVIGAGEWVEGRDVAVVLPWAAPALGLSAIAAGLAVHALRAGRTGLGVISAVGATLMLVALVLANPSISQPIP